MHKIDILNFCVQSAAAHQQNSRTGNVMKTLSDDSATAVDAHVPTELAQAIVEVVALLILGKRDVVTASKDTQMTLQCG